MSAGLPTASRREASRDVCAILRKDWKSSAAAVTFTFAGALLSLLPVLLLAQVVDEVVSGDAISGFGFVIFWAALAIAGSAVVSGLAEAYTGITIARVVARLRERAVASVLNLPPATVALFGRGEILGRVGADIAVLVASARKSVPSTLSALIMVIVASMGIASVDWRIALAGFTSIPFYYLGLRWYLPRSAPLYQRQRRLESAVIGSLQSSVDGIQTVRSHRLVPARKSVISYRAAESRDTSIASFRVFSGLVGRENFAEFMGLSALSVVGWLLFKNGEVSVGDIAAALILFHRQFVPIGTILFTFDELQRSGAALTRIVGLTHFVRHDPPRPLSQQSIPTQAPVLDVRGLNYSYSDGPKVLKGLDFTVEAGHTVCLVGRSGAGKSTVAGILSGALEFAERGVITVDGRDVVDMSDEERSGMFCVVSQENYIFAMSVRENLRLAQETASDAEIWHALELTGADQWCASLRHEDKQGLDTMLGEGGLHIDAVAAQRMALARVALSRASVVILDESTSEGDAEPNEMEESLHPFGMTLEDAAHAALRDRTAIVIAHRLSQASSAERVLVMERGEIIETGSHDELIGQQGAYVDMWAAWNA